MATLEALIATLPADPVAKGRAFEGLCQWFLTHDPLYAGLVRRVWLWNDWPGRWGRDKGIDLVAEAHDGTLWAVQAKAYAPTESVTKSDIDSFLSESNREQFAFRLLIATTDQISHNARHVVRGQEKPASLLMLSDLLSRPLDWPEGAALPISRQIATPRAHQQEALDAIGRGVLAGGRGRVIMACGTGKTLVQLWAHERLHSQRTLVLVPSLFLVAQSMQEWTVNRSRPFEFMAVCSDETVGTSIDSVVGDVSEIGVPVTTDDLRIREFLAGDGDRVIFSTYQSSARVALALIDTPLRFDLVIADEAHQLAGNASRDFSVMLDDTLIPATRRLFFTATPRIFTGAKTGRGVDADFEVASMDNEALFGPEVHRLSFGEAIRRELLSDYRVVVVGVTDHQVERLARDGAVVQFDGKTTDARTLARQIGLAKAMHDFGLHRTISFHSRVASARQFADELPDVIRRLPTDRAPQGQLVFDHVSGEMATGDRRRRLSALRNIAVDQYALLANAQCLSEGVDVPTIDAVAFIDPRRSQIDIVQAVGRAIRLSPNKSLGTVVIPVLVPEGEDPEIVLAESAFEPVWSVVRALRDHDEGLADQLDELRRKKGREGRIACDDLPDKITVDMPMADVSSVFIDALATRIIERGSSPWEEWFARLERYVEQHGDARVPVEFRTSQGYRLGWWVTSQRTSRRDGTLSAEHIVRLDSRGFIWDAQDAAWEEGFAHFQQYVGKTGHALVPTAFITDEGYPLGKWIDRQRQHRDSLSPERAARLEALPGWAWKTRTLASSSWEEWFARLERYVGQHGDASVPTTFITHDGYQLGQWINNQRRAQDSQRRPPADRQETRRKPPLSPERAARLEALPGWAWKTRTLASSSWEGTRPDFSREEWFARLERYVEQHGDARVPMTFITDEGYRLGIWVSNQRQNRSRMSAERVARLESVPGWVWTVRERSDR